ncbi:MAG: hypothetical protein KKD35_04215, partial [Elusimicrobia bacterium]|nr:hypothetical protein [Elusimicrobiota bacterium]
MTPPPLLSSHAKHGKFAKQISSAEMPNCDKRGGGVKIEIANFIFEFKSKQNRMLGILEKRYNNFAIKAKAE